MSRKTFGDYVREHDKEEFISFVAGRKRWTYEAKLNLLCHISATKNVELEKITSGDVAKLKCTGSLSDYRKNQEVGKTSTMLLIIDVVEHFGILFDTKLLVPCCKPNGHWDKHENVKNLIVDFKKERFPDLTNELFIKEHLTTKLVSNIGSNVVVVKYSLKEIANISFPEVDINIENFPRFFINQVPQNYWKDESNLKKSIVNLKNQVAPNITDFEFVDKFLTIELLSEKKLAGMMNEHKKLVNIVRICFPNIDVSKIDRFNRKKPDPQNHWDEHSNIVGAILEAKKNCYPNESDEDFVVNHLTGEFLSKNGLHRISQLHSMKSIANIVFPELNVDGVKRFNLMPPTYWDSIENQRIFMDNFAKENNILKPEDWYFISRSQVTEQGGSTLLHRHNHSISDTVIAVYPEHNWIKSKFYQNNKSELEWLNYIKNDKGVGDLIFGPTKKEQHCIVNHDGRKFYVDGYSPSRNEIYEYLGNIWHGNPNVYGHKFDEVVFKKSSSKKTYRDFWQKHEERYVQLIAMRYRVTQIWESDWTKEKKLMKSTSKN